MKLTVFTVFKSLVLSLLLLGTASAMSLREMRQLERANPKQGDLYVQYYLIGRFRRHSRGQHSVDALRRQTPVLPKWPQTRRHPSANHLQYRT